MAEIQGSMTGTQIAPDQEISGAYAKLREMIGAMPNLNFEQMYAPLIQQAQQRPVSQMPSAGKTFAAAVGAPETTRSFVQDRMRQIEREKEAKTSDVSELQKQALQGHIQQLMGEGNFKKALAQSEVLAKLESSLGDLKRKQAMDEWEHKQEVIFGKKKELEEQKAGNARQLVRTRARELAKTLGFDERMALKLMDLSVEPLMAELRSRFSRNPLTGEMDIQPEDMASWTEKVNETIRTKAEELKQSVKPEGGGKVTPSAPAPAAKEENDPIRKAHAKLFKAAPAKTQ